jgi:hypothetical protein
VRVFAPAVSAAVGTGKDATELPPGEQAADILQHRWRCTRGCARCARRPPPSCPFHAPPGAV